ncbi:PAS domain-containing protein [Yoonia sp. SS1-5]|uniref:PAS domain-containing protein n=1 Tax=Yoonia rhodophyticola TaxID=3137370 RepID=A0AAN0MJV9_9RHOB
MTLDGFTNPDVNSAKALRLADLRNAPDSVVLLNTSGRISFLGGEGLPTLQIDDLSQVVGRQWWDFWPEDQRVQLKKRFEDALAGHPQEFRLRVAVTSGDLRDLELSVSPVPGFDGKNSSILVISRDITQDD